MIQQAESEPYRVRLARAYIERHHADNLSLSEVAKVIHICPYYLCKIFKKATGLTFIEFRNRLRGESAKKLLLDRNRSVSEIAYNLGFQSLTQFNRLFRRVVGHSPDRISTQFKKKLEFEPDRSLPNKGQIAKRVRQDRPSDPDGFGYT